jgi:hypothetical protein
MSCAPNRAPPRAPPAVEGRHDCPELADCRLAAFGYRRRESGRELSEKSEVQREDDEREDTGIYIPFGGFPGRSGFIHTDLAKIGAFKRADA